MHSMTSGPHSAAMMDAILRTTDLRRRAWRLATLVLLVIVTVLGGAAAYADRERGRAVETIAHLLVRDSVLRADLAVAKGQLALAEATARAAEAKRIESTRAARAELLNYQAALDSLAMQSERWWSWMADSAPAPDSAVGDEAAAPLPDSGRVIAAGARVAAACSLALTDCDAAVGSLREQLAAQTRLTELQVALTQVRTDERDATRQLIPTRSQQLWHDLKVGGAAGGVGAAAGFAACLLIDAFASS